MNEISQATEVAKGISENGLLVMTAAFFLVISATLMVTCFMWFKSIINKIISNYTDSVTELSKKIDSLGDSIDAQNAMLSDISEGLRQETQLRIKNISTLAFDLSVEQVCRLIKNVREENNIDKKEQTKAKIKIRVKNIHDDRVSRFDYFTYRGLKLSEYTNPKWVDWVADVVESEIYSETPNNRRAYANVSQCYEKIKLDFNHRLNNISNDNERAL